MGESHSTEAAHTFAERLGRAVGRMGPSERLASTGVLIVVFSLLLPWYGLSLGGDIVQTGFGAFSFATAALLVSAGAALVLCLAVGDGYHPPRPLSIGVLLMIAGIWSGLIVVYLLLHRPYFHFDGSVRHFDPHYGIFVALGGTVLVTLAGMRRRRHEVAGRAAQRPKPPQAEPPAPPEHPEHPEHRD